jgi:cell division topological specificity factor
VVRGDSASGVVVIGRLFSRSLVVLKALISRLAGKNSKADAKNRLQFVLVQDRAGLSGADMKAFREELMDVIDKYFEINREGFDVSYKRETDFTTLLINSPVAVRKDKENKDSKKKKAAN